MSPRNGASAAGPIRVDLQIVANMVDRGARVLDVGCGDGALLDWLVHNRSVDGRGMELSQAGVNAGVTRGLSVVQGDADQDLRIYPADAFDYVILSQTLQATRDPKGVLTELVRIAPRAIVSFPNFAYWRVRWQLLTRGRMPVTKGLPASWYETANIHQCTIRDFAELCDELGVTIERGVSIERGGYARPFRTPPNAWINWTCELGVFLLHRK
ncbi:MAG: methionine biosynthesis protein MetW [Candidatus Eiseniibacteriota bacterium]